ncbi:hypothetical protein QL285_006802 [Trifolium repens]|nr:hypothetical protein QL285_006802 [Trifolium repens]
MNGITKPTQFELHYEYYENYFLLYPVNGDDEESTESDRLAEELLQGICTFAREYESVNNQRDQGIEEGQVQHPVVGEDVVGHYTWKQTCSRSFAAGESCLHFPSKVCNNYPFGKDQIIEVVNRETNFTMFCPVKKSKTSNPQYHLTKPWYQFMKNMQVKEKDEVSFLLDHPPTKLIVWKD